MRITWVGDFSERGTAYSVINRNFNAALLHNGHKIFKNIHNDGQEVTELLIANEYPPRRMNFKHEMNVCITNWEFATPEGFPHRKVVEINEFDLLLVSSKWTAEQIRTVLKIPVAHIHYGVDFDVYHPQPQTEIEGVPKDAIKLLWVGGTDKRHGFDIALEVLERLPDNYFLVAKQSAYYPEDGAQHPRLKIFREDFKNLSFLYNGCDLFLQTGRGVGFSLPTLEAIACGMPVVSTPLPPIMEFRHCARINFGNIDCHGGWKRTTHHLFNDCAPMWYVPDVQEIVNTVLCADLEKHIPTKEFKEFYSWEYAAQNLLDVIGVYNRKRTQQLP